MESANISLRTLMFNDKIDTPNLGDFLRVKEDNTNNTTTTNNNNNLAGLTLGAVLSNKRECSSSSSSSFPVSSNRTLLDIIRDDPTNSNSRKNKKSWKHFRNKLRIKPDNISIDQQHNNNNPIVSHRLSPTYPEELPVENFGQPENAGEEINEPVRMSLIALLTENDGDGSAYMIGDEDEEEDEDNDDDDGDEVAGVDVGVGVGVGAGGEYNNCCVCMVRHKGAAFIPCGHTFCRLCSRELWVQRGNCPLCNNFILEVLDIF
ncbi:uncharacterized protein LOC132049692 [Lycium ferocissimum]|uniref:uncharacterized protein LOC132049692 n=1 Tax=Lycium ferocissimum TaxID=112874 RepID=UPI0028160670|nr:uncharacterized protein LOC132049692 [Lycium ferocissimum]